VIFYHASNQPLSLSRRDIKWGRGGRDERESAAWILDDHDAMDRFETARLRSSPASATASWPAAVRKPSFQIA
jgi:hypothetical protein